MLFAVLLHDHPDRVDLREKHVAEHLEYVAAQGNRVVAGGALRHQPEEAPHGALWLVHAATKEAARLIVEGDPFFRVGLRQSVEIFHWSKGVWSEPFTNLIDHEADSHPDQGQRSHHDFPCDVMAVDEFVELIPDRHRPHPFWPWTSGWALAIVRGAT